MKLILCKAKIHRVRVTDNQLDYEGSISIDPNLLEAAGILQYERVQVVNLNNGARLETYVIEGKRASGEVCLNGPAARCGLPNDLVIIIAYAHLTPDEAKGFKPKVVQVDQNNRPLN